MNRLRALAAAAVAFGAMLFCSAGLAAEGDGGARERIVISGASGQLGGLVVRELLARGVPARDLILVSRTPEKLVEFERLGATTRFGDFARPDSLPAAYAGGTKLLLISIGFGAGPRPEAHKQAIDAAKTVGIRHIAYTSYVAISQGDTAGLAADHFKTEQYLRESGIAWTLLRNSIYSNGLVQQAAKMLADGKVTVSANDARIGYVTREDCAAAAAAVLTSPGHENKAYDITGPELIGAREIAAAASAVTGKRIEIVTAEDAAAGARRGLGGPSIAVVSGDFARLTGRAPTSVRALFEAHRGELGVAQPVPVVVHTDRVIGEMRPIWNYFGYDEAGTTLTREGRDLLGRLNSLSEEPVRIRVHHLLTSGDGTLALKWSSTNVYTEDAQGNPRYDWTRLDAIMDELTRPGIEPFVQAGFMPQALSSNPEPYTPTLVKSGLPKDMVSGGAFYPPKDYRKWEALIEAWARHSAERYGARRASSWLWELWNEPESPYWRGTPEEYFRLYDHFAAAVKRVLPQARVGGPHVTDPAWKRGDEFMKAFLEHCRSGKNAATGAVGAPLDFIAFHAKGTTRLDAQGRVEMNLRNHLKTIDTYGKIIASFPEFAKLPVYIGESDPEGCAGCPATLDPERDYRRTSQFAAYTAASFMRKQDLLARTGGNLQGAVSWAFTFADQPWFNGLRALTTNEVALPVFNTFELFSKLARRRVAVDVPSMIPVDAIITDSVRGESDLGAVASVDRTGSRLTVLLWNYHDVAGGYENRRDVRLTLAGLAAKARPARAVEYSIDERSGNSYSAWLAMGSPQPPDARQIAMLQEAARMQAVPRDIHRDAAGGFQMDVVLPRQSVKLIDIELARER